MLPLDMMLVCGMLTSLVGVRYSVQLIELGAEGRKTPVQFRSGWCLHALESPYVLDLISEEQAYPLFFFSSNVHSHFSRRTNPGLIWSLAGLIQETCICQRFVCFVSSGTTPNTKIFHFMPVFTGRISKLVVFRYLDCSHRVSNSRLDVIFNILTFLGLPIQIIIC